MNKITLTLTIMISAASLMAQVRILSPEEMKADFLQMRKLLEEQHWDFHYYTPKEEMDSVFDANYKKLNDSLPITEFYKLLTPVTSRTGNGHTNVWMPGSFWRAGNDKFFPYIIKIINDKVFIDGSYNKKANLPRSTVIHSINGRPIKSIIHEMLENYSSEGMRIQGKMGSVQRRFAMIYLRRFGYQDKYIMEYSLPGKKRIREAELPTATEKEVRELVFNNTKAADLSLKLIENNSLGVLTISTFGYYDRVDYFKSFLDSSFTVIKDKNITKLILDLRHNDGGDPFCSAPLLSYLEKDTLVYFKKASRGYRELLKPVPRAENAYEGELIVFMDSRCFSTNGHFCSLIKYHKLGTIIGKPSSGNYICSNSKRVDLENSGIMVYFGSRGYATAVDMDRTKPIMPDILIEETMDTYLSGRDLYMEKAMELFSKEQRAPPSSRVLGTSADGESGKRRSLDWLGMTIINLFSTPAGRQAGIQTHSQPFLNFFNSFNPL
jgi:hypothetical protein